jgi:hypothetical protein
MHGRKKASSEDDSNTGHVEGYMRMLCSAWTEDQHEVERSRDTEGHSVTETALANGVGQEDSRDGGKRGRKGHEDPRAHAETVREFPLTAYIRGHSELDDQLVLAAHVQPFVDAGRFPDGVKVHTNGVGRRDDSTQNDVISVQQRSGHGFADAINVDRRRS